MIIKMMIYVDDEIVCSRQRYMPPKPSEDTQHTIASCDQDSGTIGFWSIDLLMNQELIIYLLLFSNHQGDSFKKNL